MPREPLLSERIHEIGPIHCTERFKRDLVALENQLETALAALATKPGDGLFALYEIGDRRVMRSSATVLDLFAAFALLGIQRQQDNRFHAADDAKWCYDIAAAMLAERKRRGTDA